MTRVRAISSCTDTDRVRFRHLQSASQRCSAQLHQTWPNSVTENYRPKKGFNEKLKEHAWVVEAWDWIIRQALGFACAEPAWFNLPAMMRIAITTPEVMKALQIWQRGRPYPERVKPFNFVLSPLIDGDGGYPKGVISGEFTLLAPFTSDSSCWLDLEWINLSEEGLKPYRLAQPGHRLPAEVEAKTYGDIVSQYRWHREAKSLAPDGRPKVTRRSTTSQRRDTCAPGHSR